MWNGKNLSRLLHQYAELVAAVRFLSVLPLPGPSSDNILGSGYFPFVGLVLSLLLDALVLLFSPLVPQLALAAVLVVVLVVLTGGLHLDGLMDSCDGLFGGRTLERRLEIMRDSRVGSFGVLGGSCALLLKWAFVASLGSHTLLLALPIVLSSARWAMVIALRLFPSARPSGLGVTFRQTVTLASVILAGTTAFLVALLVGQGIGVMIWAIITLTALALGAWVTRRIGGLTGDTCGAIGEVTEIVALLSLLLLSSRFHLYNPWLILPV